MFFPHTSGNDTGELVSGVFAATALFPIKKNLREANPIVRVGDLQTRISLSGPDFLHVKLDIRGVTKYESFKNGANSQMTNHSKLNTCRWSSRVLTRVLSVRVPQHVPYTTFAAISAVYRRRDNALLALAILRGTLRFT